MNLAQGTLIIMRTKDYFSGRWAESQLESVREADGSIGPMRPDLSTEKPGFEGEVGARW